MRWITDYKVIQAIRTQINAALPLLTEADQLTGLSKGTPVALKENIIVIRKSAEYPASTSRGMEMAGHGRNRVFVAILEFTQTCIETTEFEETLVKNPVYIQVSDTVKSMGRHPLTLTGFFNASLGLSPNSNNSITLTFNFNET